MSEDLAKRIARAKAFAEATKKDFAERVFRANAALPKNPPSVMSGNKFNLKRVKLQKTDNG